MNVSVRGTVAKGELVPHATIKEVKRDAGKYFKERRFAEITLKEYSACIDIPGTQAFDAYMSSPEELPGDKNNGFKVTVYSLSQMEG